MQKIPDSFLSLTSVLLHIVVVPIFFLGFILLYNSSWIDNFLSTGLGVIFNTLMLSSILLVILIASRISLMVIGNNHRISWWRYGIWTLGEMFVFSCFAALYMALIYGTYGYFPALGKCINITLAVLFYPVVIIDTMMAFLLPNEEQVAEEDLVRFADSTGRLKLVIAHDVILYVEAQENYVVIHYLEGEKTKEYTLRQTMRGIEELMAKHGIIRCQRSYFVNPRHVTVLRRDKEGFIQAELDVKNSKPVPVSPKYYEQLSKML